MIVDCKAIASRLDDVLKGEVKLFKPVISGVIIGKDAGTEYYMKSIQKIGGNVGIDVEIVKFDSPDLTNGRVEKIVDAISGLNNYADGIILGKPLPKCISSSFEAQIINAISPYKDIDCVHPVNLGFLLLGNPLFEPCTPSAVIEILDSTGTDVSGKDVVIVGRSSVVGRPLSIMLSQKGVDATVTICHTRTENLKDYTISADILVVAAGRSRLITGDMIKDGAIVIDVGTNFEDGKLVGDVDFESTKEKAKLLTPVPGGVGVVTTRILLKNAVKAKRLKSSN